MSSTQYVGFALGTEKYGIPILKVQEVIKFTALTRVPHAPSFIAGVLNLRGNIVPVIDLRKRFGLPPLELTLETRIIVLVADARNVGLIVDRVSEVLDIAPEHVDLPPRMAGRVQSDFIQGIGRVDKELYIVLEVDRVLSTDEKTQLEELAAPASA